MDRATHILFLCTHNSARSVLAEALANHWAGLLGRPLVAHSAGSAPSGRVNPHALAALAEVGIDRVGVRSKSWDEFAGPDAPALRIVITLCDSAAAEACPVFSGAPVRAHWGYADPSTAPDADRPRAFTLTRQAIGYRVLQLLAEPLDSMDDEALRVCLQRIGRT